MEVVHVTSRKRETYRVQMRYSILFECALGIEAITQTYIAGNNGKIATW